MAASSLSGHCFAHRGLHNAAEGVIENSRTSIARAIAHGFGIEIDVQRSSDNVAMVFHDFELERLTNASGLVADLPASELEDIALKNSSDRIWRMSDFLQMVDGRVPVLIEVKSDWSERLQFVERLFVDLAAYQGVCGIMSFDPDIVSKLHSLQCEQLFGLGTTDFYSSGWGHLDAAQRASLHNFDALNEISVDFIAHDVRDLERAALRQVITEYSLELLSWTVRDRTQFRCALKAKAAPIFEGEEVSALLNDKRG